MVVGDALTQGMPRLMAIASLVLIAVLAGLTADRLARRKGRSRGPWVFASALFILPLFLLAILPTRPDGEPA